MLVGGQAVATELEVVADAGVGREEVLGVPRRLEPLHLPFSSPRRLVRHLDQVVQVALALSSGVAYDAADLQHGALPNPERTLLQLQQLCRQTGQPRCGWPYARRRSPSIPVTPAASSARLAGSGTAAADAAKANPCAPGKPVTKG